MCDMEVVKKCSPPGVMIQKRTSEPKDSTIHLSHENVLPRGGIEQTLGPYCEPLAFNISVEIGWAKNLSVGDSPTCCMQCRNLRRIFVRGGAIEHVPGPEIT
jgi:hypothetical protein